MLSWICPDCGCDCSPTDQECPDCSDLMQAGMVALARTVQEQRESFPPRPQIPLQELVPRPPYRIQARPPVAATARHIEPKPEPISAGPPVLPLTWAGTETPAPPAIPLPPPLLPMPSKPHRRAMLPGWLISLLVATLLSIGGAALVRNMDTEHKAEAASPGARQSGSASQEASDRTIEITALRVLGGPRFGTQLQYIIVNHSATQLPNVPLRIAVRSTASPASEQPLFTITAVAAGLAPYSSREMTTEIPNARAANIPAWDRLRAEVEAQ